MEIFSVIKKSEIPVVRDYSEQRKKLMKMVASLTEDQSLKIKVKNESEASRINS